MTTGPATKTTRSPRALVCRIIVGDARHADLDAAFRRHLVRHEGKVAALSIAELRRDAQAVQPADDAIADPDLAQLAARGRAVGVHHDDGVHPLARDDDPAAIDAHVGSHVRRRIEIVWHGAIAVRDAQQRVPLLDRMTAERNQLLDAAGAARLGRRRHLELQLREVVVGAANLEVQDLELTAALDHGIEDGVQELRVDQVALRPDDDGVRGVSDMVGIWIIATDFTDNTESVATDFTDYTECVATDFTDHTESRTPRIVTDHTECGQTMALS